MTHPETNMTLAKFGSETYAFIAAYAGVATDSLRVDTRDHTHIYVLRVDCGSTLFLEQTPENTTQYTRHGEKQPI